LASVCVGSPFGSPDPVGDDRRGINLVPTAAGREKNARALRTYCEVLATTLPPELIARFE
jgi:hypothetical protein